MSGSEPARICPQPHRLPQVSGARARDLPRSYPQPHRLPQMSGTASGFIMPPSCTSTARSASKPRGPQGRRPLRPARVRRRLDRYVPVQNRQAFGFLDAVVADGGLRYHTNAPWGRARRFSCSPNSPNPSGSRTPTTSWTSTSCSEPHAARRRCGSSSPRSASSARTRSRSPSGKGEVKGVSVLHKGNLEGKIREAQEVLGLALRLPRRCGRRHRPPGRPFPDIGPARRLLPGAVPRPAGGQGQRPRLEDPLRLAAAVRGGRRARPARRARAPPGPPTMPSPSTWTTPHGPGMRRPRLRQPPPRLHLVRRRGPTEGQIDRRGCGHETSWESVAAPPDFWFSHPRRGPVRKHFQKVEPTEPELRRFFAQSPLRTHLTVPTSLPLPSPPLALGIGHVALLLASGHLDGLVQFDDRFPRLVVRGTARKHSFVSDVSETDKLDGSVTTRTTISERIDLPAVRPGCCSPTTTPSTPW